LKINNTIFVNLGTVANNTALSLVSNTGLAQAVSQGDYLEIKWECPDWTGAAPEGVKVAFVVYMD